MPVVSRGVAPVDKKFLRLVLLLGILVSIAPLSVDLYLPALPRLRDELEASDALVQFTVTGMLLGLGLGQLIVGPLSDAFGRKRPLIAGLVVHACASVSCALAPNIEVLAGIRVIQGFAAAAIAVVTMATIRDQFEGQPMVRLLSRMMLVSGLAPILAPTFGGQILRFTDWRGIFTILFFAVVAITLVVAVFLDESLSRDSRRSARPAAVMKSYIALVRDPTFIPLALIGGLTAAAAFSYISGSSFILQDGFGVSSQAFAVLFGINAVAMLAGAQLNPRLTRGFALLTVMRAANFVGVVAASAVVAFGVTEVGGVAGFVVPMAVVMFTNAMVMPNTPALALHRHGSNAGAAAAVLGCVQFGTGALIAPAVGALGADSAVPLGLVMAVVLGLAGVLLAFAARDRSLQEIGGPSE